MDKRTFDQTIARLEDRGLFTTKSVAWTNPEGSVKTSKFVMVVDYPAEEFSAFAEATRAKKEQLKKAAQASKKEEAVDVVEIDLGAGPPPKVVVELPDMKDIVRLVEADDETARATFLSEWRTCSQMFGYQPAPLIRAELFHKALGEMLERLAVNNANGSAATAITTSSVVVSANERILHLGAFISFLSLELFCQLVPLKRTDPELEALMADPVGKKTTVRELPARLRSVIDVDTISTVHYVQRIVRMLFNLRLARPLIISDEDLENREIIVSVPAPAPVAAPATSMSMSADSGDISVLAGLGGETSISTVDFVLDNSDEFTHIQVFSGRAPVYGLHDKPAPLLAVVPVDTAEDLTAFWKLQRGVVLGTAVSPEDPPSASAFPSVYEASNAKVISRLDYWTSEYFVTPLQRSYIQHIVEHQGEGEVPILDDRVELERRARIISAPIKITEAVCRKAVNKIERHRRLVELEKNRAAKRLKKTAQEALAAKLANERMQLASDWTAMARRYLTQRNIELTPELELRIGHLQRREALKAVSGGRGRLDPDVVAEAVDGLLGAPTQPEELQPVPQSPIVPPPEKKKRGRPPKPKPAPEPEPELQEPPRSEEGAAAYEPVGEGDDYLIPEVCRIMLAKPHGACLTRARLFLPLLTLPSLPFSSLSLAHSQRSPRANDANAQNSPKSSTTLSSTLRPSHLPGPGSGRSKPPGDQLTKLYSASRTTPSGSGSSSFARTRSSMPSSAASSTPISIYTKSLAEQPPSRTRTSGTATTTTPSITSNSSAKTSSESFCAYPPPSFFFCVYLTGASPSQPRLCGCRRRHCGREARQDARPHRQRRRSYACSSNECRRPG